MTERLFSDYNPPGTVDPMILSATISDLFFNYQHDELDRYHAVGEATPLMDLHNGACTEGEHAALMKDAADFATTMGGLGITVSVEPLVSDFFGRL